ncbi:MAG: threonyl-tRNA synthetase editing domain-containing protein [Desulfobacterales bacterium]
MRVLFWYCDRFEWTPAMRTLDSAPEAEAAAHDHSVVAFVHVEPGDTAAGGSVETKLVKHAKWLARKWEVNHIVLHSFTHLAEEKAEPEAARILLDRVQDRLEAAGYAAVQTPYGYFLNLGIRAPGHPLARIFKSF